MVLEFSQNIFTKKLYSWNLQSQNFPFLEFILVLELSVPGILFHGIFLLPLRPWLSKVPFIYSNICKKKCWTHSCIFVCEWVFVAPNCLSEEYIPKKWGLQTMTQQKIRRCPYGCSEFKFFKEIDFYDFIMFFQPWLLNCPNLHFDKEKIS